MKKSKEMDGIALEPSRNGRALTALAGVCFKEKVLFVRSVVLEKHRGLRIEATVMRETKVRRDLLRLVEGVVMDQQGRL